MEYQQISCSLFDRIESLAVTKRIVSIIYFDENNDEKNVEGFIKNIFSERKTEFLLVNGVRIRLDKIKSITEK